jgi:hypothetical protein
MIVDKIRRGGFMARRKESLSVVMVLVCMMFFGIQTDGRSQEKPAKSTGPVVQESPAIQQPYTHPRMKRRGLIVIVDLNVTPLTYTGSCPAVFTLKGQIYANKAMTVLYKIVRSDNVPMEPVALTFEKEERKEITYTWQIGDPIRSAAFNEWALIEAIYPINTKIRSNVAFLKGSCGDRTNVKQQGELGPQVGQKGQPAASTGFPGPQPGGSGPMPMGLPMNPPGQTGQPVLTPGFQGGPGPGNMPIAQPGQSGPGPSSTPMFHPGQKGPIPSESPIPPGNGKGSMSGSLPLPQPDVRTSPGTEK